MSTVNSDSKWLETVISAGIIKITASLNRRRRKIWRSECRQTVGTKRHHRLATEAAFLPLALRLALVLVTTGCGQSKRNADAVAPAVRSTTAQLGLDSRRPAQKLSEYGLFQPIASQVPAANVVPFWLNGTSFLDGGQSEYLIYIPSGKSAHFRIDAPFDFPVGTVLIQHIRFPNANEPRAVGRLIETRLLIHKNFGWTGTSYLWNDDQSDAERAVTGGQTVISRVNRQEQVECFTYRTPNMNECKQCHVRNGQMAPIGVTARNLNRMMQTADGQVNQLIYWQRSGLLTGVPADTASLPLLPDWRDESVSLDGRARGWLDVNCAHCHSANGPAIVSGLDLSFDQTQPVRFGVYKPPVAAGRGSSGLRFSILPRDPDKSFLVHRIRSTELGVMMPPIGRSTADAQGIALMTRWIQNMQANEALANAALNPMAAYGDAVSGGDPERGRVIFVETQKCIQCHRVDQQGGSLGPNLSDVGMRTGPEYLLESIVDPSAKIVQGYKTEVVILSSGQIITGVVQAEDQYDLVLADLNATHKIEKAEIEERNTSDVSTMPSMANVLSIDQVRDLVAYLRTLKTPPATP
ncbi:MAG: c-type cytochrome [Pirellulaceae bacterium]|nr:c-type cytochrome [Pirellulaceae bacterium]